MCVCMYVYMNLCMYVCMYDEKQETAKREREIIEAQRQVCVYVCMYI